MYFVYSQRFTYNSQRLVNDVFSSDQVFPDVEVEFDEQLQLQQCLQKSIGERIEKKQKVIHVPTNEIHS